MNNTNATAQEFFDRYQAALLARDGKAVASMYAVPSLILFPGNSILVSDARQTEEFFAASWADVTWSYRGGRQERSATSSWREPTASRSPC